MKRVPPLRVRIWHALFCRQAQEAGLISEVVPGGNEELVARAKEVV